MNRVNNMGKQAPTFWVEIDFLVHISKCHEAPAAESQFIKGNMLVRGNPQLILEQEQEADATRDLSQLVGCFCQRRTSELFEQMRFITRFIEMQTAGDCFVG